jgi:RimJ/RimL family protein N-acetyltransferase
MVTIAQNSEWMIREFAGSDRSALVKYANNPMIAAQLRDHFPSPYTESDADAWLAFVGEGASHFGFAIADDRELIGGIGLQVQDDVHRRSAEIGYWVAEPFWGRGIATWAVRAVTEWGFAELDVVRIYAAVFESNPASARVLEKCGYELEGRLLRSVCKKGVLMDSFVFAILRAAD